ncbi:MAG: hypothetical protein EP344_06460 [Bacteroidetes bacterium]|nr:MAG: hypothetical protein EP344_06460 [Bacteroidota bacterium]
MESPYFNQREDVLRLWHLLLQSPGEAGNPELAWKTAYPGERFDPARWRHLQSFLVARIEQFLAQRAWEQHPLTADLQLASALRKKQLDKAHRYTLQRAGKRLGQLPHDQWYYQQLYQLEWEKYTAAESQTRSRENNLAAAGHAQDVYLVASKLRLACLMESRQAVSSKQYDQTFLPALMAYLETSRLREEPLVALYYYCYRMLIAGTETDFRAFRRQLERQSGQLPADERRTFLLLAVDFCIRRLNSGEQRYIREAFDLYKVGLDTEALWENGYLSRFVFKDIVALGLRLEAYDWVESFINQNAQHLEEKYRVANRNYNLARLFFTRKNYDRAIPLLAQVDERDLLLNLDSRVMLLRMYFETGEWDALDALISSFRILLLRKKRVIGYHQSHYLNTLRYIQKLTRLNTNDRQAVARFRQDVESNKAVIEKEWLLLHAR